jgi:hypothetical protein
MAEVTFFYSLHCSLPPAYGRGSTAMRAKSLGELKRRFRAAIVQSRCQLPQTKLSKIDPAKFTGRPCTEAARRLSLAVLMDRGQARLSGGHSSRLAIELGLWPRFNDALASILSSALTNGEGGNYTGVAKPCKGAARDFEMRTNRPNTRRRNTGEVGRDNAHYKVFASPGKSRPKKPADTRSAADASRHK